MSRRDLADDRVAIVLRDPDRDLHAEIDAALATGRPVFVRRPAMASSKVLAGEHSAAPATVGPWYASAW